MGFIQDRKKGNNNLTGILHNATRAEVVLQCEFTSKSAPEAQVRSGALLAGDKCDGPVRYIAFVGP